MKAVSIYAIIAAMFALSSGGSFAGTSTTTEELGGANRPAIVVTNIIPLKLGSAISLSAQSAGVTWRGHTFHLVSLGSTTFNLDTNDCLKAEIKGGVACFDDVDYDISCAVFDTAGQLLGTARAQCNVRRVWAGNMRLRAETITLDFGTSLDYKRADHFLVSISNRKVLTPDQWPKPEPPPAPLSGHKSLQFRLVAEANSMEAVEEFPDPNTRKDSLRVLRTVLLDEIAIASAIVTNTAQGPVIEVTFTEAGAKRFAEITGASINKRLAIVFDGKVLSAPTIRTAITNGRAVISGNFTAAEAEAIAQTLKKNK